MSIKRYGIHFNYGDPVMIERPDGQYYSLADLIAAGCLVPVPDGEPCKECKGEGSYFIPIYDSDCRNLAYVDCVRCGGTGESVRLVPIAEVEG